MLAILNIVMIAMDNGLTPVDWFVKRAGSVIARAKVTIDTFLHVAPRIGRNDAIVCVHDSHVERLRVHGNLFDARMIVGIGDLNG